jgi:hypothetical protein
VSRVLTNWFLLLPFDSSIWLFGESSAHIWLFGESSAHNLVSSSLLDSSDCTSPTFDDSLVAPLLVFLYEWFSLPVLLFGCFSL